MSLQKTALDAAVQLEEFTRMPNHYAAAIIVIFDSKGASSTQPVWFTDSAETVAKIVDQHIADGGEPIGVIFGKCIDGQPIAWFYYVYPECQNFELAEQRIQQSLDETQRLHQ
jgi:hypothetical protein